jgi:hypothetical protein
MRHNRLATRNCEGLKVSCIQADDPALINWMILAVAIVVGSDKSKWTWSATPPMHAGLTPFCFAIPPKYGQRRSLTSGPSIGSRSFVLKMQWTFSE